MQPFIQFLILQWPYVLAFVIVLLVILYLESNGSVAGMERLTSQQVIDRHNSNEACLIDIRDKENFKKGHITGAINIPPSELEGKIAKKYLTKPAILLCKTGQTCKTAAKSYKNKGFTDLAFLNGGLDQWQADNLPLIKASKKTNCNPVQNIVLAIKSHDSLQG